MKRYDVIIAGGGMAGLSLAWHMVTGGLEDRSILIVDRERKEKNDRTWCFWSDREEPHDDIVHRRWSHIEFCSERYSDRYAMTPYDYRMIRGEDFYAKVLGRLDGESSVDFRFGGVESIIDDGDGAIVTVDGESYRASWVFDGTFVPRDFTVDQERYRFVKQHFRGRMIETENAVFEPETATLFDFRVPQNGATRFVYILPYSDRRALVEYTLFSTDLLPPEEYESGIDAYIRDRLGDPDYTTLEEEDGIIPMTDQPFPRRGGNRILRIGTKGGMVKASTGYAFHRTQRDSARIVDSLRRFGHPFHNETPPARYRLFDATLLEVLARRGDRGAEAFTALFERNPLGRIWRFLDEEGSVGENIRLMTTVPLGLFTGALLSAALVRPLGNAVRSALPGGR